MTRNFQVPEAIDAPAAPETFVSFESAEPVEGIRFHIKEVVGGMLHWLNNAATIASMAIEVAEDEPSQLGRALDKIHGRLRPVLERLHQLPSRLEELCHGVHHEVTGEIGAISQKIESLLISIPESIEPLSQWMSRIGGEIRGALYALVQNLDGLSFDARKGGCPRAIALAQAFGFNENGQLLTAETA